jgi:hypothetical protein
MHLYRYEECPRYYHSTDHDGEYSGTSTLTNVTVELREFKVLKTTPKGAWIHLYSWFPFPETEPDQVPKNCRKWVMLNSRRKWACKTKEEALKQFLIRKRYHLSHLEREREVVAKAIEAAKRITL